MNLLGSSSSLPIKELSEALRRLADEQNVWIGTSSWKYPGWIGMIYDESRYLYRGKASEARFERDCLTEYAEVFPTVCVDAGYYRFPSPQYIEGLVKQVRPGFRFSFKVTDDITACTFPNLPRHGAKAGKRNEHFLNAALFKSAFLSSLAPFRDYIGTLIFEFSHLHPRDFTRGRDFVAALDAFLADLPPEWQYSVEIRNRTFLCEPYFEMLSRHQVAHVFNHWERMPPITEQDALPGAHTTDFDTARLLLRPGRAYEQAVASFSPYTHTHEVNEEARSGAASIIQRRQANQTRGRKTFIYVNNRLEGNAINTVIAILEKIGALRPPSKSLP
ncbi:MAG: DUF72 domain-containing protein [Verrucomicrobiaceae bacterium]|nr:DUF72 domain-containing protein [Verrucomicrobiaceae bacterium]